MYVEVEAVEEALGRLSNVIFDNLQSLGTEYKGNLQWADAAVDRALSDMLKIRQWLERGDE